MTELYNSTESLDIEGLGIAKVLANLSDRDFGNIDLASRGLTAREAADAQYISEITVKNQRANLIARFAAVNMVQVVRLSCEAGLFEEPLDLSSVGRLSQVLLEELELASQGLNRVEAGKTRLASPKTVANNRSKIYEVLDARNMCHAVRLGFDAGYLPLTTL